MLVLLRWFWISESSFSYFKGLYKPSCKNIEISNPRFDYWMEVIDTKLIAFGNFEVGIAYVVIISCSIWEKMILIWSFLRSNLSMRLKNILKYPRSGIFFKIVHVNTNMAPKPQDYIKKISNSNNFHANYFISVNSRNTAPNNNAQVIQSYHRSTQIISSG